MVVNLVDTVLRPVAAVFTTIAAAIVPLVSMLIDILQSGRASRMPSPGPWNWMVENVFDPLKKLITEAIPKAFEEGVKGVSKAWDDIAKMAKYPINFVVETVLNNGIFGAVNGALHFFGINDKDLHIPWPPSGWGSYEVGGYTGAGGRLDPTGIVHAGEIVWSQDDISRWGGAGVR